MSSRLEEGEGLKLRGAEEWRRIRAGGSPLEAYEKPTRIETSSLGFDLGGTPPSPLSLSSVLYTQKKKKKGVYSIDGRGVSVRGEGVGPLSLDSERTYSSRLLMGR